MRVLTCTYSASPHDPRAGSYNPPGEGLSNVSKVSSCSILRTEIALISAAGRNVNSTLSTEEATGWEIFMPSEMARYTSNEYH